MEQPPKWYRAVVIAALVWNLLGCIAYLSDVMLSEEAVSRLSAAQQAMHAARPAWSVAATALAVWFGAAGCVGLILRRRWAMPLLVVSFAGVIAQDVWLFLMSGAASAAGPLAYALQGFVLLVSLGLLILARRAGAEGWIAASAG